MKDFFLYLHTFGALPHFPRPDCIGKETRNSCDYRVEGRWKRDRSRVIFQYTLDGEGCFERKGHTERVPAGKGFLCESHDPHMAYYFPAESQTPWHFVFIDLYGEAAHFMAKDMIKRFGAVYSLPPDHPFIRKLLSFHVFHEVGCTLSLSESLRLAMELFHSLTASVSPIPENHADHALIRQFREIVQSEIGSRISVGEIARRLSVSAEHLARIFKQQTGLSPHIHIQQAKMLAACSMLKSPAVTIKEIAARLGYETPALFSRTFRRIVGSSPHEFRENGVVPLTFGPLPPVGRETGRGNKIS